MNGSCRAAAAVSLFLLTGCSIIGGAGNPLPVTGFVVGDEPEAVRAGAAILAHGGNAVDAVTATYFALSVTYPVAAGLGGGGLCIVHDPLHSRTEAFDFLPRELGKGGAYAVPGNVSGFSLLHTAYGRIPWQRVISPAESSAAAGFPISEALAARLASSQDLIRLDAGLSAEFLDESGHVKPLGTIVAASALADTLSQIRSQGPAALYRGAIASELVAYSRGEGGGITADDLAAYAPSRVAPNSIRIGDETVFLPPSPTGAGEFAAALLSHLVDSGGQPIGIENLAKSVAAATKTTMDTFRLNSLPRDLGATGFAAEDPDGLAVACAVTMDGPFGSAHTATGTGITLASAPGSAQTGLAAAFLTPVIAKSSGGATSLAGAGAGGPNGTATIALALLELAAGRDVTRPGVLHSTGIAPYDTVNVIGCQNGICTALPDPGAHGLGAAGVQ
ncbi:MAG TPA: gamma-glutamyltransferase [Rhizomicrobium sp.]|jgi:gamma-glutamyltranspeptidase/glutathione hydrolase|nr:gamma-glutamyltransferase [Rhizomicrobium sp.]